MISEMSVSTEQILTELDNSGSGTANKKSKKQPKGILKNSNPHATYHKHHHRRKLEELVTDNSISDRQAEIIPTHTHQSGRHKHHHEHHKHRNSTRYNYVNFGPTATTNRISKRCLKITEKVTFNIASEASNVCILSGQKLIKNAKNGPFRRFFENLKLAVK